MSACCILTIKIREMLVVLTYHNVFMLCLVNKDNVDVNGTYFSYTVCMLYLVNRDKVNVYGTYLLHNVCILYLVNKNNVDVKWFLLIRMSARCILSVKIISMLMVLTSVNVYILYLVNKDNRNVNKPYV